MKSIIAFGMCVTTVIFGLELNEAATLLNQIQQEVNTTSSTEYSGKGLAQNLDALMELSRNLDLTESEIKIRLKNLEKIKHDLELVQVFKQGVNGLLGKLVPENSTLKADDDAGQQGKKKFTIFSDTDKRTWYSAKAACQDKGMKLASIENEDEQQEMVKTIKSIGYDIGYVWIGASDIEKEGKFIWSSSGRPLSYENWHFHNDGGSDDNCLAVGKAGNSYEWFDRKCGNLYNYACEY